MNVIGIIFIIVGIVFLVSPRLLYYLKFGTYGQIMKAGTKEGAVVTRNKRMAFVLIGCLMIVAGVFFLVTPF
ncbi:MAG: hypothetical protein V1887_01090 [Candidatus Aenigmatarchaeota archaeon]